MPKIQARNIDEALYQRIEASAMKHERSLEGEIRIALRDYYTPVEAETAPLSLRERWQQQTGERLQWLLDQLVADGVLDQWQGERPAGIADIVRIARQLGTSPGQLMDLLEGRKEMLPAMADELAGRFSASADWLLSGTDTPFPVLRIGHGYRDFLLPEDDDGQNVFEFIRIDGGHHDGTLIIIRVNARTQALSVGVVTSGFILARGMGGGGHGYLKEFLLFLKTKCHRLAINTFDFKPDDPEFDFWSVIGQHHPIWFRNAKQRSTASWLQQLYSGTDPADWFEGWQSDLDEIAMVPFGGETKIE